MYSFLAKLVVSPILYIIIPIFISFFLKKEKVKKIMYAIAVLLIILFTNTSLLKFAEEQWYAPYDKPLPAAKVYEYGIILGGYSQWDWDRNRVEYGPAADRLIEGVRLYKLGKVKKIVLASDGSIIRKKDHDGPEGNPNGMLNYLADLGIPSEDVIMEVYAKNTRENVTLTKELLGEKMQSDNTVIITSAVHMKRSLSAFKQEGLSPDYFITDTWPGLNGESESFCPSVYTLAQWQELLHEWIGHVVYKIRGW